MAFGSGLTLDSSVPAGTNPAEDAVLTLDRLPSGRLVGMLTDGRWRAELFEAPWPPVGAAALPGWFVRALGERPVVRLRLQLPLALDDWAWEHEIAAATGVDRPVPRYLVDLSPAAGPAPASVPLVVANDDPAATRTLLRVARQCGRPLVVADADTGSEQLLSLERSLRRTWRDGRRFSDVLGSALVQTAFQGSRLRLYGDAASLAIGDERVWRPVTALSFDLAGSTALLGRLGAEGYSTRLQAYHDRCRTVIQRFGGSLSLREGNDGGMAYFGFPLAVEDAADRALSAAWQLTAEVASLGLAARMGVASGWVAVSSHEPYGDDVHLAARLRERARPGGVLVAPGTQRRAGSRHLLERVDFERPVDDYPQVRHGFALGGPRPPESVADPLAPGPFVGREHELGALARAWAAARAGPARWVAVTGEAGIGKSRLLRQFAGGLRVAGDRCIELSGQAQAASSPFAALVDGLRGMTAVSGAEPPSAATADQRPYADLLLELLLVFTGAGPCCLIIDDVHWLDPSSVELLGRLRDAGGQRPLLVVIGERLDEGLAPVLPFDERLSLQRLSPGEAAALAARLGGDVDAAVLHQIVERAEGVPLFVEECLHMVTAAPAAGRQDVPAKLEDLLMARLDGLGMDLALAQVLAVLGRECTEADWELLFGSDDPLMQRVQRDGGLRSLVASGLVQESEGPPRSYRFKHALIRDVAYNSIWSPDRQRLHGLWADLLVERQPARAKERPDLVAQHLEAAGRVREAGAAWHAAARFAAQRQAHAETLELAGRALAALATSGESAATTPLQLLRASALIALHGYGSEAVEHAYREAERAGAKQADPAAGLRVRLGLEASCVMRGDLVRAEELARDIVARAPWYADKRLALQAHWALANVLFHRGDWRGALAGFDTCLAHYDTGLHRRTAVQDPAVMCLGYSSWIHFELGEADESLERIERLLALAAQLDHPFSTSVALSFAASIKRLCGDGDSAWRHAVDAVHVCERGGFRVWLAHAWMVRGQLRADRGDLRGGDDDMDRGYALWYGSGARISCATYLITRAEIALRQGRTALAQAQLDEAWRISEAIGEHYYRAEWLRLQGLAAWQRGDTGSAGVTLQSALQCCDMQAKPGLALRCALSLGALQVALGDVESAVSGLAARLQPLRRHHGSRDLRWAQRALEAWRSARPFDALRHVPWEPQ